ncbi:MAG TPA: hypothetical protein VKA38_01780 [Draconibacterium sp.]|nr:hypothetical protein [Draconibacterium sp.]
MFTFGIFTTHLPYIAFVVFYAYFLIFGVEKASKGEIQVPGTSFTTEFQVVKHVNTHDQSSYYYQSDTDFVILANFEAFHFKQKIKNRTGAPAFFHQFELVTSLSNRPPPCLV